MSDQQLVRKGPELPPGTAGFRFHNFSEWSGRPVCVEGVKKRIGKVEDLVFLLVDPYPTVIGIYMEYGWGKPTQFVPWERVKRVEEKAIFIEPAPEGEKYPPFVDEPRWIMLDRHLMGRTVLDLDGRRTEVVNDVHLLETRGKLLLVHVDTSFNGFFRRWGLGGLVKLKDQFISWKFVQPLSVEDATATDEVALSITREEIQELPSEDLADMLEELSGEEQQALFSVLETEKAAETLVEAEPRAQRQIVSTLDDERAKDILSELSPPQMAELFSILPHDEVADLMPLLHADDAERVKEIMSEPEATAEVLSTGDYVAFPAGHTVAQALSALKGTELEPWAISYLYVVGESEKNLLGVVDLREAVQAREGATLEELMNAPVVTFEENDTRTHLVELFAKYNYRMIPVTDADNRILGVVRYNDIM